MNKADIVISVNGRDAGKRFIVIETDEEYSQIVDGKGRRTDKPKRKKNKHLRLENKAGSIKTESLLTEKLIGGEKITNNEIRHFLAEYAAKITGEGGKQDAKR